MDVDRCNLHIQKVSAEVWWMEWIQDKLSLLSIDPNPDNGFASCLMWSRLLSSVSSVLVQGGAEETQAAESWVNGCILSVGLDLNHLFVDVLIQRYYQIIFLINIIVYSIDLIFLIDVMFLLLSDFFFFLHKLTY